MAAVTGLRDMPSMVIVMGATGAGKSYFINQLAGREVVQEGATLDSCTLSKAPNFQSTNLQPDSSKVLVIDTPGFDDSSRPDSEILTEIARLLAAQYELGVQLKGVIYIHRITDIRYSRSAIKIFEIFKKICGDRAMKNNLLVTSRWSEVDQALGSDRERQLKEKFWSYMLNKGSNMSRFHGDRDSAISLVSQLLSKDTVVLELQEELVDRGKNLDETAAGVYVSDNLEKMKQKYQEEISALARLRQELLDHDKAARRQLQRDWEAEQNRLREANEQQVSLQKPVGTQVRKEIKEKKSGLSTLLSFVPAAISIMGMFVGIPPGVTEIFTSWIGM
ncbi:MAG: hypothetical protein Q9182_006326 [Xanthomendoza sp. 2 TL-2023]